MMRLLVLLAACSTPTTQQQPIVNRVEPPKQPFAAIAGEWSGKGYQPDVDSSWTVFMKLDASAEVGAKVGTIEYPTLGCRGDLIRLSSPSHELHAREQLVVNPPETCVDNGTVIVPLTPNADGMLDWKWNYPDGKFGASATLAR